MGARLRRALISAVMEIGARRSLALPFTVPMRDGKVVGALRMNRTRNSLEMNETIERGSWAVSRSERNTELSMNRPSPGLRPPSPRLAGRGQGEGCQAGSWSQCMRKNERGLSMNRPLTPSLSPSDGERVAEGRGEGGSWSQCVRKNERGLSMNPEEHPTSNIQRRTLNGSANPCSFRRSVFDVGWSMFSLTERFGPLEVFREGAENCARGGRAPRLIVFMSTSVK